MTETWYDHAHGPLDLSQRPPVARPVAGRLNGITAEPGTLLGPIWTGEVVVVIDQDDRGVILGYPTEPEMRALASREPRSVYEARVQTAMRRAAARVAR